MLRDLLARLDWEEHSATVVLCLGILSGFGFTLGRVAPILLAVGGFAVWNGYFILFEGLRRGQTPGKRTAGIRVVMDTGHAVTFGAAAARNLLRIADFLPPPYLIGLLLTAFHPRGKRLGDPERRDSARPLRRERVEPSEWGGSCQKI